MNHLLLNHTMYVCKKGKSSFMLSTANMHKRHLQNTLQCIFGNRVQLQTVTNRLFNSLFVIGWLSGAHSGINCSIREAKILPRGPSMCTYDIRSFSLAQRIKKCKMIEGSHNCFQPYQRGVRGCSTRELVLTIWKQSLDMSLAM